MKRTAQTPGEIDRAVRRYAHDGYASPIRPAVRPDPWLDSLKARVERFAPAWIERAGLDKLAVLGAIGTLLFLLLRPH